MRLNEIKKTLAQQLGLLPKNNKNDPKLTKTINNSLLGKSGLTKKQYDEIGDNIWQAINKKRPSIKTITPRKTIFARLAAVASIVLIAGVLLLQQETNAPNISLASVTGKIDFINKSKTLKPGFALTTKMKAEVKINLTSSGKLRFQGPGSLKLIQVTKKDNKPTQKWYLASGIATIKLQKGSYANFSLTTPHALIRVTGTAFSVTVTETKTTLSVQEGKVDFKPINKPIERIKAGENRETVAITTNLQKQRNTIIKTEAKQTPKVKLTEKIKLKNGTVLTGRVISQTASEVKLITKGGTLKIPTTAIESIRVIKSGK